ncbi:MAG: hypothetical protein U9Q27_01510 [Patescibacteria group bacterium]|nr:hypothetical protein [Patescibacteria group bacterium]
MNRVFKIVGRDKKTGKQSKKRIYTSEKKYKKHAQDLINRYITIGYDVQAYELIDDKWIVLEPKYVLCSNCFGRGCKSHCNNTGKILMFILNK